MDAQTFLDNFGDHRRGTRAASHRLRELILDLAPAGVLAPQGRRPSMLTGSVSSTPERVNA